MKAFKQPTPFASTGGKPMARPPKKLLAKPPMVAMAKGGMVNCGASMPPAQKRK